MSPDLVARGSWSAYAPTSFDLFMGREGSSPSQLVAEVRGTSVALGRVRRLRRLRRRFHTGPLRQRVRLSGMTTMSMSSGSS